MLSAYRQPDGKRNGTRYHYQPLLFVFKLHGQTRKYQFTFNQSNDTLYLHWGIKETPDGNQAATPCPKKL